MAKRRQYTVKEGHQIRFHHGWNEDKSGCRIWTYPQNGRAFFSMNHRRHDAQELALRWAKPELPKGKHGVIASCGKPLCVNPGCLSWREDDE